MENIKLHKELSPVIYGEKVVKCHTFKYKTGGENCFDLHWHDRMEILRIKSGKIKVSSDNLTDDVILRKDDIAVISPTVLHKGVSLEGGVEYNVIMFEAEKLINGSLIAENMLSPLVSGDIYFEIKSNNKEILKAVDNIFNASFEASKEAQLKITGYLYILIGLIFENSKYFGKSLEITDGKFKDVINYINHNFTENINTADLSKKFGYSEGYFCRTFKKVTGLSTIKYINLLRLEMSQSLLKSKNTSIKEVSLKCGFDDAAYFSTLFQKYYGITPSSFKKQNK